MVLEGWIDDRNMPWINITVKGAHAEKELAVIVDTGFTGELWLPFHIAVPLGLELSGLGKSTLADGVAKKQMLFSGSMRWSDKERPVTIVLSDADVPLLGGGLLHGYELHCDYVRRVVTIKEAQTPPQGETQPASNLSK